MGKLADELNRKNGKELTKSRPDLTKKGWLFCRTFGDDSMLKSITIPVLLTYYEFPDRHVIEFKAIEECNAHSPIFHKYTPYFDVGSDNFKSLNAGMKVVIELPRKPPPQLIEEPVQ